MCVDCLGAQAGGVGRPSRARLGVGRMAHPAVCLVQSGVAWERVGGPGVRGQAPASLPVSGADGLLYFK